MVFLRCYFAFGVECSFFKGIVEQFFLLCCSVLKESRNDSPRFRRSPSAVGLSEERDDDIVGDDKRRKRRAPYLYDGERRQRPLRADVRARHVARLPFAICSAT